MSLKDELDPVAILTKFGIVEPISVTIQKGGSDTAVWRVEQADKVVALRVFHPEDQSVCEVEQIAMRIAAKANLPVPQVLAAEIWHDHPVLLLSWCPGRTLVEQLQLQPWSSWSLGKAFGRMQAMIHAAAVPDSFAQQTADWVTWKSGDDLMLQQELRKQRSPSISLLHMDYHLQNVMVKDNSITGILDWTNVKVGDPRADYARTHTILHVEPWTPKPSLSLTLLRWTFGKAWRRGYQEIADPLEDMALFYAWAGTVMVNDLAHRVDQPDSWFQRHHLEEIRSWANQRKQCAGLPT
jgi:aminoglycoside 3'-phosphotransferase-2